MNLVNKLGVMVMLWGIWFVVASTFRKENAWVQVVSLAFMLIGGFMVTHVRRHDLD